MQGRELTTAVTHLDTSTAAFADGIGHRGPRGVNHGQEANKAQSGDGEVGVLGVEHETSREVFNGKVIVTETW